jgi:DNA invertase Pin-like site-specific DNA recombinase/ssDNA-binding Zn-finger/Zn-ribbon topoisomerase 1
MARTANRGIQDPCTSRNTPRWSLGKYIRLSKEDMRKGETDNSYSVKNQAQILDEFHLTYSDEFTSGETYIDDGCTGTDTNREDFQRLLADIHAKKINCVIVKDLSRLARNYTDAGSLIENLFVQMNVRFISLGDNIDSHKNPDSITSMIVPITNVFNENYCAQTSKKIRQVFDYKRRKGEYIGAFAPYGYAKNPEDTHSLIVDDEAAGVVKQVFEMFLSGMAKGSIARHLNDHGVLSPADYKRGKGLKYHNSNIPEARPLWTGIGIDCILRNRIYTGDMVQGKTRKKSYKIHIQEKLPEDEWFIVENTHEAIIGREDFSKAQQLLLRDTRTAPKQKQLYLFSGFLKCPDCGRAMSRSEVKGYVYYRCSTYASCSKNACTIHTIKHYKLEAAVLYAIQQQAHLAVSYSALVAMINESPERKTQAAKINADILNREKELSKILRYKQSLYEDWKDGILTRDDYTHMSADYEEQAARAKTVIINLKAELAKTENGIDTENPFLATFRKYENIGKLTRDCLIELVDHIKIYEGGDIAVRFKQIDDMRHVWEYIEVNTEEQQAMKKVG